MGLTASNWARGDPVMADACEAPVWTEMGVWKGKGEWGVGECYQNRVFLFPWNAVKFYKCKKNAYELAKSR